MKPLKDNATDEEKVAYDEKITANTAKANRIIVMVRHGQYNLDGTQDTERCSKVYYDDIYLLL